MVADLNPARGGACLLDDACGLMSEHDRHWIAQGSFDDLEIGVAKARGADFYEHVGRLQLGERYGFDRHRRLRGMQHRGSVAQGHQATALPSAASASSISAELISHSL